MSKISYNFAFRNKAAEADCEISNVLIREICNDCGLDPSTDISILSMWRSIAAVSHLARFFNSSWIGNR